MADLPLAPNLYPDGYWTNEEIVERDYRGVELRISRVRSPHTGRGKPKRWYWEVRVDGRTVAAGPASSPKEARARAAGVPVAASKHDDEGGMSDV